MIASVVAEAAVAAAAACSFFLHFFAFSGQNYRPHPNPVLVAGSGGTDPGAGSIADAAVVGLVVSTSAASAGLGWRHAAPATVKKKMEQPPLCTPPPAELPLLALSPKEKSLRKLQPP